MEAPLRFYGRRVAYQLQDLWCQLPWLLCGQIELWNWHGALQSDLLLLRLPNLHGLLVEDCCRNFN